MKRELFDDHLVVTLNQDEVAEIISDKLGVPVDHIECSPAILDIELVKN